MGEEEFDDGRAVFPSLRKKINLLLAEGKARNHLGYDEFLSEPPNEVTSKVKFSYRKKSSIFAFLNDL